MSTDTATGTRLEITTAHTYLLNPGEALRHWLATREGERRWAGADLEISVERVYHLLTTTQASRFGLLLAQGGVIIWSRFSARSFSRLRQKYEEAAAKAICFWWDGQNLHLVGGAPFFALIHTLPAPTRSPRRSVCS